MSDTKNPLRKVVMSPHFQWRRGMFATDEDGNGAYPINAPSPSLRDDWIADNPANVGPLLDMLTAAGESLWGGQPVRVGLFYDGHGWIVDVDDCREHTVHGRGPTPCIALCRALLAMPGRP